MIPRKPVQRSHRRAATGAAQARPEIRRQPVPDHCTPGRRPRDAPVTAFPVRRPAIPTMSFETITAVTDPLPTLSP